MKKIVFLALLAAGCKHQEPAVEIRTVEVPVVRVTSCMDAKDIPAKPGPLPRRPGSISAALDVAVAKVLELTSYAEKADAVMRGCAKEG